MKVTHIAIIVVLVIGAVLGITLTTNEKPVADFGNEFLSKNTVN